MIEHRQEAKASEPALRRIELEDGAFVVDAELLAPLFGLPASRVPVLMREGAITSVCERGGDDDEGRFRLTFFYGNRRARLSADRTGRIVRRSIVDFGERPVSGALHRPGG